MKRLLISAIIISATIVCAVKSFADPLLLTDAEMQKLKQYFPNEDINTISNGSNHATWNGNPIRVELPLNQEKRLIFPAHVTVDVKGALTSEQLQVINNDKSIYLKALKPFASTRLYITLQDSQEVVLLDISTNDKANSMPMTIDVQQNNNALQEASTATATTISGGTANADNTQNSPTPILSEGDTYVALTRYAWQQLYAPLRLLKNPLGITRVPMQTDNMLSTLIYGDKVYAHPLASWTLNDLYITAIDLRNKYPHNATMHIPNDICGDWVAATLYPRAELKMAGTKNADSTTLLLLSRVPFAKAMEDCHVSS